MVQAPGFFTFAAQLVRSDWSRSVAVMVSLPSSVGLEEEVREDRDGRLALDDRLRGGQLAQKLGAGDGDLEVAGGCGGGGHLGILVVPACECILGGGGQGISPGTAFARTLAKLYTESGAAAWDSLNR